MNDRDAGGSRGTSRPRRATLPVLAAWWPLLAVWLGLVACLDVGAQTAATLSSEALVRELRQGGYNLYFRHAETDWSQSDRIGAAGDWTSCDPARVRQLSERGRDSARAAGAAMRALGIPVGRVLASPYCRTVETAQLLDLGPVEPSTDIINMRVAGYFGGRDAVIARARARLATVPPAGTNTVLVAHGNVASAATPVYPGEAEAVIFRPDGEGFEFVGRLTPAQWQDLADTGVGDGATEN